MDDLISREAAIEALCRAACRRGYCGISCDGVMAVDTLPSVEPEYSTDVEEVLDYLDNVLHPILYQENWNVYSELHDMVEKLPSAEPRKGHWVFSQDDEYEYCTCSECGHQNGENWIIGGEIPFCSYCGAKMVEGEKDER